MSELRQGQVRRIAALAAWTGDSPEDFTPESYDPMRRYAGPGRSEWLVLKDSEAAELAREDISESLWAFNAKFLASQTGIDVEVFKAIQANDRCEDNTPAIRLLVDGTCGFESLADEAISTDGRGHFLATYDGEECELDGNLFAYRTN